MESNDTDPAAKEVADDTEPAARQVLQRSRSNAIRKSRSVATNRNQKSLVLSNPSDAKWIRVYINGDEHFPGFKCVVNSKYYRNFDAFLSYLTEKLRPGFGAVRNIYTPLSGNTIRTLEELRPHQKYVVSGGEKFRKLEPGYADIGFKSIKKSELKPTFKRKYSSIRSKPLDQNPVTLYFYKNGSQRTRPVKMVFQSKDLISFDRIFDKMKHKMQCGPIKRLYSLTGKPINSLNELQHEQSYVVVDKYEVFKNINFGINQVKDKQSVKDHQKKLLSAENSRIPIALNDSEKQNADITDQSNENIPSSESPISSPYENEIKKEIAIKCNELGNSDISIAKYLNDLDRVPKVEGSVTYELNFQVKELDLDVDLGGVYRAREKYYVTEGATEIQDDIETAVEFSQTELDPEEVEEEEEVEDEELTPDMERSMQHLTLDAPDELVAFLPSMQGKQSITNERTSSDKYNMSQSQTFGNQNLIV